MDKKKQAYQGTLNHLQRSQYGVTVIQQTFVMSCHGTILQEEWNKHFEFWGLKLKSKPIQTAKRNCIKAAIMANHMLAEVRRSLLEGLKLGGRGGPPGAITYVPSH